MAHPRELLVLRHAKSAWDTDAPADYERPLSGRGVRDAPRMGHWLAEHGLAPDAILCSPARRARETGRAVCEAAGVEDVPVVFDDRIYGATLGELVRVLGDARPAARRLLLVGHNPGFEELVRQADAHVRPGLVRAARGLGAPRTRPGRAPFHHPTQGAVTIPGIRGQVPSKLGDGRAFRDSSRPNGSERRRE